MDVIEIINNETDINKLKSTALDFLTKLYCEYINTKNRLSVYEFIIGCFSLAADFKLYENPKVSVVIPVKNEFMMTSVLLNSIKHNTIGIDYEIIIADDNSTDEIQNIDLIFKNVRRIVNDTGNKGFIYNVKNAVSHAKGEYILLINNDMLVLPDYLKELLDVIENDKTIGIVGAKTLNIENKIDECGVKMHQNGEVEFLSQNEDNDFLDEKNFIECDYCSGCAILFRRDIWEKSGGFDINYAPAYYEDSDFAFNLKYNYNLKSVCVPKSKIYHFKGVSYSNNIKEKNEIFLKNKEYFLKKWGKTLV